MRFLKLAMLVIAGVVGSAGAPVVGAADTRAAEAKVAAAADSKAAESGAPKIDSAVCLGCHGNAGEVEGENYENDNEVPQGSNRGRGGRWVRRGRKIILYGL